MNLAFLDDFQDPYLKEPQGRGALLAGVLLGYMAYRQASRSSGAQGTGAQDNGSAAEPTGIDRSPLFKQIQFGRLDIRTLKRLLARVPQLIAAYRDSMSRSSGNLNRLCAKAGELLISGQPGDLGTDGNFAFTVGFVNAVEYYWQIFGSRDVDNIVESRADLEQDSKGGM
ncbi:MAG TPA: CRISPR-associated protein [Firmicutes bacterium]|nr:CRISPR-associated protein [Bacillota bacterium]